MSFIERGRVDVPRGMSLPIVIMTTAVLTAAMGFALSMLSASTNSTTAMYDKRRLFYLCDGVSRLIAKEAQNYVTEEANPNDVDMKKYICEKGGTPPNCATAPMLTDFYPSMFEMDTFAIEKLADPAPQIITQGPLTGMQAIQMPISLLVSIHRPATESRCEIDQEIMLGSVSMFQFFVFSDGNLSWAPGQPSTVDGRVHVNGDLCIAGNGTSWAEGLKVRHAQATGAIYSHDDATVCGYDTDKDNVYFYDGTAAWPTSTAFVKLTPTNDHYTGWAGFATSTWKGHVLDGEHNVAPLKLPVQGSADVQHGVDASGNFQSNTDSSRVIVDPVMPAIDDDASRGEKFACKADIRIINGVWYKRDDTDPDLCGGWPGIPIWSDHPGTYTVVAADAPEEREILDADVKVGQYDIGKAFQGTTWDWGADPPTDTEIPTRYSYYRFSQSTSAVATGRMLAPGTSPVVSYGTLKNTDTNGAMAPGHWLHGTTGDAFCSNGGPAYPVGTRQDDIFAFNDGTVCTGPTAQAKLLNGARSGFVDPQTAAHSPDTPNPGDRLLRSRMLPLNFDVGALRAALSVCTGGELGHHFPGTCEADPDKRVFNGIVFIANTWENSNDGYGVTSPVPGGDNIWTFQGNQNNASQAPATASLQGDAANPDLPYELCSKGPTDLSKWQFASEQLDDPTNDNATYAFVAPDCADYDEGGARANAVRVINATTVGLASPDVLENGLTIASNGPVYLIGDMNTSSDVSTKTATPWVPFLVTGDQVRFYSKKWRDEAAPWGDVTIAETHPGDSGEDPPTTAWGWTGSDKRKRPTVETTYNLQVIAGHPETTSAYSGGLENFPGFAEDWDGINVVITGAFVKAFTPVYFRWKQTGYKKVPNRPWSFDPHLADVGQQPPGAPRYDVQAIRVWRR